MAAAEPEQPQHGGIQPLRALEFYSGIGGMVCVCVRVGGWVRSSACVTRSACVHWRVPAASAESPTECGKSIAEGRAHFFPTACTWRGRIPFLKVDILYNSVVRVYNPS